MSLTSCFTKAAHFISMPTQRTQPWLHFVGPCELSNNTKAKGVNYYFQWSELWWVNYKLLPQLPHKRKITTYTTPHGQKTEMENLPCALEVNSTKHPQFAHNAVWPTAGAHKSWMPRHHGNCHLKICWSSVWHLLYVIISVPKILRWILIPLEIWRSLTYSPP